jgi:hypothetical protein
MGAMSAAEQWRYSHQHAAEASQLEEDKMAGQQHAAGQGKAPARKRRSRGQNSSGTGQQACGQAAAEHAGHTEQQEGSGDESGGLPVDYQEEGDWNDEDESPEPSVETSKVSGTSDSYADDD